jgi:glycosyltransferase involved in cell wall biosynthesis
MNAKKKQDGSHLMITNKSPQVSIRTESPNPYPRISLITPSLNQGKFIEATIQSVLSQNYPNLEYIVMDGGSSDNTVDILKRYSDQLKWVSEKDKGQTDAINKGLRMANGEILAYLNADDVFLPETLFKVAQIFMEHPETMWVTGQCRIVDEDNREIRRLITAYKNFWLRFGQRFMLLITDYISQPATFWRAKALEDFGYPDESLHYAMDYEYWLRLYSKYPPLFIPEYLAAFKIHPHSKNTNAGHKNVYIDEERLAIQRHTNSKLLLTLHDIHRWLMTAVYSIINRG